MVGETVADVANVIWCTGYEEDYGWVDLPGFEGGRGPEHVRGVVTGMPGLFLLGRHLLYSVGSGTLLGVGRDARHLAARLLPPVPAGAAAVERVRPQRGPAPSAPSAPRLAGTGRPA